jgi:hypothetical protein
MTYSQIRPLLDTFDIVLFQGSGFVSWLIGLFCNKWSHVGLIVKCEQETMNDTFKMTNGICRGKITLQYCKTLPYKRTNGVLMLFESAIIGGVNGVQLSLLSDRIRNYNGKVFIRSFMHERTETEIKKFNDFISKTLKTPYEKHILELLGMAIKIGKKQEDTTDFACSELNAEAFQELGFLPQEPPSNKYSPADFANGMVSNNLKVGTLGDVIRIL